MNKAKIADLKNNLSRYLAYVREGGEVLVLDRDTPVARLVPFAPGPARGRTAARPADERLADLDRQGLIKRGSPESVIEWLGDHRPLKLPRGSDSVVGALLELRREDAR